MRLTRGRISSRRSGPLRLHVGSMNAPAVDADPCMLAHSRRLKQKLPTELHRIAIWTIVTGQETGSRYKQRQRRCWWRSVIGAIASSSFILPRHAIASRRLQVQATIRSRLLFHGSGPISHQYPHHRLYLDSRNLYFGVAVTIADYISIHDCSAIPCKST